MNELDEFKTVLIVGNGFDLNINFPTSYSDFMGSQYFNELILANDNWLAQYLNYKKKQDGNWIDMEKELGVYANILKSTPSIQNELVHKVLKGKRILDISEISTCFRKEYFQLCNALKKYLIDIENNAKSNNADITKSVAHTLIRDIIIDRIPYYVVNFNYTRFVECIIKGFDPIPDCKILQIHGSLKKDIVFGVQDSLNLNREHVFIYKSHNINKNVEGLPRILENANKIIFFGYSLGETDHSYFSDFFETQATPQCHSKTIKFYHYGQDAYDDIIWQLKALTNNRTSYLNQYNNIQFEDSSITLK